MRLAVLGSGSGGNALVVRSGANRLLVDAGFSCRRIRCRLEELGEDGADLGAMLLTHEHQDHVRGTPQLVKRFGLPVYATAGTLEGVALDEHADTRTVRSGEPFEAAGFRVEAFRIPHDAREPVGYVIEDAAGRRLGVVHDLGSRTRLAWGRLRDLDALVIETNHDLQRLRHGPYPWFLKQRVASRHGHLSQTNNSPALAFQAVAERLDACGSEAEIVLTRQDEATPWIELRSPPAPRRPPEHRRAAWEDEPPPNDGQLELALSFS